ncbi:hypothetical protein A6B34_02380 [Mycolicibacterium monacense]|nr:hypothetical protein A6B34_02380 [Mycolicibacterium monacense]
MVSPLSRTPHLRFDGRRMSGCESCTGVIATETHTAVSVDAATADSPVETARIASAELVRDHQNAPTPATVDNPDR